MKKLATPFAAAILALSVVSCAEIPQDLVQNAIALSAQPRELDNRTVVSGLKEALSVGTDNAVKSIGRTDGYFGNELIKILLPKEMQKIADVLKKVGFQKQVDDFTLSMNRAAEKAADKAIPIFVNAIKEMSFEDAKGILKGGDTAATDYFRKKTSGKIYDEFRPVITKSLDTVGVTNQYKQIVSKYDMIQPFAKKESLDLDHYVTNKALDGLFSMVAQEEKKIRENPSARVTELLKKVFGSRLQ